jgi:hypothetical protein
MARRYRSTPDRIRAAARRRLSGFTNDRPARAMAVVAEAREAAGTVALAFEARDAAEARFVAGPPGALESALAVPALLAGWGGPPEPAGFERVAQAERHLRAMFVTVPASVAAGH